MLYDHSLLWPALGPLAARRQLIFYDQRGRGASEQPRDPTAARIEHDAADLGALRVALGLRSWDVLGHSWGAGVALLGTERDRGGVRRLVLVDPVGVTSDWMATLHSTAAGRLWTAERARLARYDRTALSAAEVAVHSAHSRSLHPAWFADRALAAFVPLPRSTSVTGAAVSARLWREGYDWRALVSAVDVPTIVISGECDILPVAVAQELVSRIPRAAIRVIPDAGHLPFLESPEQFFELVEEFLSAT